ncbi:hypothetical protein Taro_027492, partial [Colocasia esculenta]|nr:hypothetical protein [Colocasia esculenta]
WKTSTRIKDQTPSLRPRRDPPQARRSRNLLFFPNLLGAPPTSSARPSRVFSIPACWGYKGNRSEWGRSSTRRSTSTTPMSTGGVLLQNEWRAIGVQQSRGWVHYAIHRPEPHIMLFRRPLNYQQQQENQVAQQMLAK